jgi:hypothetical protein
LTPYSAADVNARIVELYIDPNLVVRQIWTASSGTTPLTSTVTVPTALKIANTYLIYSEVSYLYKPAVGYVMAKAGINLNDYTFTRPRQSLCVFNPPPSSSSASCPTS